MDGGDLQLYWLSYLVVMLMWKVVDLCKGGMIGEIE